MFEIGAALAGSRAQALPPTTGISDPHIRRWAEALSSAWQTRNGGGGNDDERFVLRKEVDNLAAGSMIRLLTGAASADVTSLQANPQSNYSQTLRAVSDLVTSSVAYEYLRSPLGLIAPSGSQFADLLRRVDSTASVDLSPVYAAISSEQSTRASADTAAANLTSALTTRVSNSESVIAIELTTRSDKDNSLAQAINTIWTSIGGSAALIQDGALAAVSPAAVTATKWLQVQAAVTDPNTGLVNSASIKFELNAYASKVDGTLNTTFGIKANTNGVVTGVALVTSAGAGSPSGTATSNFLIMADRLSLVSPSNNSLTPVPFSVDGSGNAVFSGTVYAAAGVFGGSLSAATGSFAGSLSAATGTFAGSLSAAAGTFAGTLTAGALTVAGASLFSPAFTSSNTAVATPAANVIGTILTATSVNPGPSGSVVISVAIDYIQGSSSGAGESNPATYVNPTYYIARNGTIVATWTPQSTGYRDITSADYLDTPGGSAVYTLQHSGNDAMLSSPGMSIRRTMLVLGVKR